MKSDHDPIGRVSAPDRAPGYSASPSSAVPNPAPRAPATGDPWTSVGPGWDAPDGWDEDGALRNSWRAFAVSCDQQIRNLVQVYFEIVYPIFPLFHKPTFIERIHSGEHLRNQGLFASTMAVCSLVSGRARDGALYSTRWRREDLLHPPSETFYAAAKDSIPRDLANAKGFNYMRACAVLAIASIQNGQIKNMQKYAGLYHTLTLMEGFHDEKLWPKDISPIEVEERRRLFWSIYTLDIYSTIVWGGVIRHREAHSLVRYPSEVDDEFITPHGYGIPPTSPESSAPSQGEGHMVSRQPVTWMHGWNFTTDLYRVLEHVVDGTRRRFSSANGTQEVWSLFSPASMSEPAVMERVRSMYAALPPRFRETPPITGDISRDLFGFQSANIQATLQLLRMVLLSAEETGLDRKCDVAGELLTVFSKVPVEYLKAISSPLLHHLGGVGYILGSVMEGSLSDASYQRVRTLLRLHANLSPPESLRGPSTPNGISPVENKSEPIVPPYAQAAPPSTGNAMGDQLLQFQIPQELLADWPWPLDNSHSEGFLPLAFE
ncbi:hypothetical protein N7468_007355 [Penicillium chermesinum]|uniref:Xylanolytic transcriptional activator regulatory domain-containing protein n=1 Tax=Penicillium chermesinum TaxID=63820 RepID=A0A9W9TM44_9EURO|nr:uncharacterized protein N7468_007355 [Penicillium chermesinum]KAJ5226130.1 hypothetical protein N7468_007355 [Penicillium chermesinum]